MESLSLTRFQPPLESVQFLVFQEMIHDIVDGEPLHRPPRSADLWRPPNALAVLVIQAQRRPILGHQQRGVLLATPVEEGQPRYRNSCRMMIVCFLCNVSHRSIQQSRGERNARAQGHNAVQLQANVSLPLPHRARTAGRVLFLPVQISFIKVRRCAASASATAGYRIF